MMEEFKFLLCLVEIGIVWNYWETGRLGEKNKCLRFFPSRNDKEVFNASKIIALHGEIPLIL